MPEYFTKETENAIIRYNKCENYREKNDIYNAEIYDAFFKMVENLIFSFKFRLKQQDHQTLRDNTIGDITIKMPLFNKDKIGKSGQPAKAFSFFNTIAKNHILQEIKKENKTEPLQDLDNVNERNSNNIDSYVILQKYSVNDKLNERKEFRKVILEFINKNQKLATTVIDEKILDALDYAFLNPYEVAIANKKSLFSFLKEFTGLQTQEISAFLKKFRIDLKEFVKQYNNQNI